MMAEADKVIPEVILFVDKDFNGAHKHIFKRVDNLDEGPDMFRGTTSMVVKGFWTIFVDPGCSGFHKTLPPKTYNPVTEAELPNDQISSLRQATAAEIARLSSGTGTAASPH